MGARVVPDNRPGTHLGFRQQGSSGSAAKVQSGGRSSKLGHLKKKQANGNVLVSWHKSLHDTSIPAVLMAPAFLQYFFFSLSTFKKIFIHLCLQRYIHGALEDMHDWYIQHCVSHINMK